MQELAIQGTVSMYAFDFLFFKCGIQGFLFQINPHMSFRIATPCPQPCTKQSEKNNVVDWANTWPMKIGNMNT